MPQYPEQTRFTTKPQPLMLEQSDAPVEFTVRSVHIAAQLSAREFEVHDELVAMPDFNCWFYVTIQFPSNNWKGLGYLDGIITNGEQYFLVNHSLIAAHRQKQRIVFSEAARELINNSISKFVQGI